MIYFSVYLKDWDTGDLKYAAKVKAENLEDLFSKCNHMEVPDTWPYRSMSVGDVVKKQDGPGQPVEWFRCDPVGWANIENPLCKHVEDNKEIIQTLEKSSKEE